MSQGNKTGFGSCYYLQFNFFRPDGEKFYCKKKETHKFNCDKCPYEKRRRGK